MSTRQAGLAHQACAHPKHWILPVPGQLRHMLHAPKTVCPAAYTWQTRGWHFGYRFGGVYGVFHCTSTTVLNHALSGCCAAHRCRAFGSDITVVHLLAAYVASVVPAALELSGQQATLAAARKEGPLKQGELPDMHGPAAAVHVMVGDVPGLLHARRRLLLTQVNTGSPGASCLCYACVCYLQQCLVSQVGALHAQPLTVCPRRLLNACSARGFGGRHRHAAEAAAAPGAYPEGSVGSHPQ